MQTQELSREELMAQIATLKAQAKALPKEITMKVSTKGAVSLYGLGRFPITLYAGQWEKVLAKAADIREFITTNESELARK